MAEAVYAARMSELAALVSRVLATRRATLRLCEPLTVEDHVAQSMPDASPVKWHLAHTTWFFERFVLRALGAPPVREEYDYLFNSYYESVGERQPRANRGLLSRPTLDDVLAYRRAVDAKLADLRASSELEALAAALELGIAHEEQHQELVLTDVKHLFGVNPLLPAYRPADGASPRAAAGSPKPARLEYVRVEGGLRELGAGGEGFSFDNERPRHKVYVAPFEIGARLVTCEEYLAFVRDRGYDRPELWLSEGWAWVKSGAKRAPLYWLGEPGTELFTLRGRRAIDPAEPVCHVSYFEADAYARWASARLPTEAEWETAARLRGARDRDGAAADDPRLHPAPAKPGGLAQMIGDCWEWTSSAYAPYPGFRPLEGSFGEYNGKFMVSQMVLRGGSCATPPGHARETYRNFFPPSAEWQLSGIRLARDV
jgi:ergothioneine biosynthesis protein EgtB